MSIIVGHTDSKDKSIIGEKIREYRKQQKISQKELAKRTGLSIATIQGYEQGKFSPKISNLKKIAEVLNVSVEELGVKITTVRTPDILVQKTEQQMDAYARIYAQFIQEPYMPYINIINQLNASGQAKALEQLEMLAKIPEYRREQSAPLDSTEE